MKGIQGLNNDKDVGTLEVLNQVQDDGRISDDVGLKPNLRVGSNQLGT